VPNYADLRSQLCFVHDTHDSSVADPHHFNANPNPSFHVAADPDPTYHFDADGNLRPLVYIPWSHGSIFSLHSSIVFGSLPSMAIF
jgi:hypothetical protein